MSKILIPLSNEAVAIAAPSRLFTLLTSTVIVSASLFAGDVKAEEKSQELPTVSVIESQANDKYNSTESAYYKITGPLVDTPKTITTVSRKLMNDQGVTTLNDALRNVPGLSIAAGEGGSQGNNLAIRGFSARNDFFVDGMRDFGSYNRDPFNMESIEVVQGPSATLFGRGSAGGVIQQNTKQAFLGTLKNASVALGTNNTRRLTTDINTQLSPTSALRLNLMAHDSNVTGRDQAENRRYAFAPSLAFGLGTSTRLSLNFLHQEENNIPDYGIPWLDGRPAPVNRSNFYGFKSNDYLKTDVNILNSKFEHDLDGTSTFRNQTRYARYTRNAKITEPQVTQDPIGGAQAPLASINVTANELVANSVETYFGNQADITTKFKTYSAKHDLVTGISLEHETSDPTRIKYTGVPTANLLNPDEDRSFAGTATVSSQTTGQVNTLAGYAADTINFNKKWQMVASLCFDHILSSFRQTFPTIVSASRTDDVLSWNDSLVYKPRENGSIYASYGTSFNPSAESFSLVSTAGANSSSLKPEKNTVYEIGTKWDFFHKKLSTTFAIFRAQKTNAKETDPNNSANIIQVGTQQVDGFQAQISGKITDNWNINSGYSYFESQVIKSAISSSKGFSLANTPRNSFNIFTTYTLPSQLIIGGGANYIGSRYASSTLDTTGYRRQLPGYLTLNLMAKYPVTKSVTMQVNINNLTNKYYYDQIHPQHIIPGEGRTLLLTTNISF